jgi:aminoglycoside phosphotransferase
MGSPQQILTQLPLTLRTMLKDAALVSIDEGMSGTSVLRVEQADQPARYLKIARRGSEQDLQPEVARLLWLQNKLPVPQVLYMAEAGDLQYCLLSAIPGLVLYHDDLREHLPAMLRQYALALREIHALPIANCPFDARLDVKIAQARRRLDAGLINEDDFDEERAGQRARSLFKQALATRPADEDLVFTHGDYCTPNILIDPPTLTWTGLIDWGRAGIADRYQDLALAARSIDYNFGADWIPLFFENYGISTVDPAKIEFYRLLDEFF